MIRLSLIKAPRLLGIVTGIAVTVAMFWIVPLPADAQLRRPRSGDEAAKPAEPRDQITVPGNAGTGRVRGPGPEEKARPELRKVPVPSRKEVSRVARIQNRHNAKLLEIDGVHGVATGVDEKGRVVVKVFAKKAAEGNVPANVGGIPVETETAIPFSALQEKSRFRPGGLQTIGWIPVFGNEQDYFHRPVPIGVSIGLLGEPWSGTLGCRVKDAQGNVYILSNNHVIADENNAKIGTYVVQPSPPDFTLTEAIYGPRDTRIAKLSKFIPIKFLPDGPNYVDAALAITSRNDVGISTPDDAYGTPNSATAKAFIGLPVQKVGRTTGHAFGVTLALNATVDVGYSAGTARFVDQIIFFGPLGAPGDSGSLIVTDLREGTLRGESPVALLFAGGGAFVIGNPIDTVLKTLGVTIDGRGRP